MTRIHILHFHLLVRTLFYSDNDLETIDAKYAIDYEIDAFAILINKIPFRHWYESFY